MTEKYAWEGRGLDEVTARELHLFIVNDADLYRQQHVPIIKNLVAKKARGVYDPRLAAKLFGYLVESGAKKYYAEYAGVPEGGGWSEMFPKKLRDAVAEELRDSFEGESALGNYDEFIPKKYQPRIIRASTMRKKARVRLKAKKSTLPVVGGIRR